MICTEKEQNPAMKRFHGGGPALATDRFRDLCLSHVISTEAGGLGVPHPSHMAREGFLCKGTQGDAPKKVYK